MRKQPRKENGAGVLALSPVCLPALFTIIAILNLAVLRAQYGLSDALALTFTSGYYNFFAKKLTIPGYGSVQPDDVGIIPVKAGIKVFFSKGFYVGAEAGAGFETPGAPSKLLLSPNVGFATNSLDLGIRYENFRQKDHSYGLLALRLASGF